MDLKSIFQRITTFQNILQTPSKHTKEESASAKEQIDSLRHQITQHNETTVQEINKTILDTSIWHLEVLTYDRSRLMIAGNYDLSYYCTFQETINR